MGHSPITKPK